MSGKCYLNDRLVDADNAQISVANPSFLQGVGLFETLRAYAGRPFRLAAHIERLRASAECFHLPVAEVIPLIPQAVREVLDANRLTDARIRITVTPQSASHEQGRPILLITAQPIIVYPMQMYEEGMAVLLCTDYRQSRHDPLAGHKSTSYLSRLFALRIAQERGCHESLWFTPANHLAEGCISNVFLVRGGVIRTPPLDTPVLPGVTRAAVLEVAKPLSICVEESPCSVDDLLDADEVFLTNALMEVMPVTRIERKPVGTEKPGPLTRLLLKAYRELAHRESIQDPECSAPR